MKTLLVIVALLASGCMVASMQKHWHDTALRTARFDMSCKTAKISDIQHGEVDSRYRVAGCGKSVVYLCEDDSRHKLDAMDRLALGGRSSDVTCKPVK